MDYDAERVRPRGRPRKTCEVTEKIVRPDNYVRNGLQEMQKVN